MILWLRPPRTLTRACFWTNLWLVLNTDKSKVMTTEAQPPSVLSTPAGLQIEILDQKSCRWVCPHWSKKNTTLISIRRVRNPFAVCTMVGPALWGRLFPALWTVIPPPQEAQQHCLRVHQQHGNRYQTLKCHVPTWVESSRTCLPEGSPFRAQGNNKPKLISTLTTSASQIQ